MTTSGPQIVATYPAWLLIPFLPLVILFYVLVFAAISFLKLVTLTLRFVAHYKEAKWRRENEPRPL